MSSVKKTENGLSSNGQNESTLASRLQSIIRDRGLKKKDFARSLGVSANYIYLLTSGRQQNISESLAKLIEGMYGYPPGWVMHGAGWQNETSQEVLRDRTIRKLQRMSARDLHSVAAYIRSLDAVRGEL